MRHSGWLPDYGAAAHLCNLGGQNLTQEPFVDSRVTWQNQLFPRFFNLQTIRFLSSALAHCASWLPADAPKGLSGGTNPLR